MGFGFDFMFTFVPIMTKLIFGLVFGVIVASLIRSGKQWHKNNQSPQLTVDARVIAKRHDISRHHSVGEHHHYHTTNTYFVTFEVESGDRMELQLQGHEYGLLIEGDKGRLTFQGTRYLGFERT